VLGLAALAAGAEAVVRGAARIAAAHGISPLVVGLTVVAFGGSMPELLVGVLASAREQGDLALGNVIGSNIANIGLVLGVSALNRPLTVDRRLTSREMPIIILATAVMILLGVDRLLSRVDGALMLGAFVAFVAVSVRRAVRDPVSVDARYAGPDSLGTDAATSRQWLDILLLVAGIAGLLIGAELVVRAAVAFARDIGISELVVGLTIVAIGTSLPELATSAVAAYRREPEIAIGNVVGSNIFNAVAIMGAASFTRPVGFGLSLFEFEIPVLGGATLLLFLIAVVRPRLARLEGAALVLAYIGFVVLTVNHS
jgi:cation:H+ antiporter